MRKVKPIAFCLVLLILASCALTACTPSKCANLCETCGKCLDEACQLCSEKCVCHKCQNVCPTCSKCTDLNCQLCTEKCACHKCDSVCTVCGACTNEDCTEDACSTKCDCHTCQSVCVYCNKCTDSDCTETACQQKCSCPALEVTRTSKIMLSGTTRATPYYVYKTNKVGPKIVIIGGIHGNEGAGWNAALDIKGYLDDAMNGEINQFTNGIRGTILLMPKANIIGCNEYVRYIKTGTTSKAYDLNRSFPTNRYSSSNSDTVKISNAMCDIIDTFLAEEDNYTGKDVIVDLHESQNSWTTAESGTSASLGDTLIFKNNALWMDDLIYYYNQVYRLQKETQFISNPSVTAGSFSLHFSTTYPDNIVFTVETNRQCISGTAVNGNDQELIDLEVRVRQQINVLNALFDFVWERADVASVLG